MNANIEALRSAFGKIAVKSGVVSFEGVGCVANNPEDVIDLINAINNAEKCEVLVLSGNSFGILASKALAEAISKRGDLKRALFSNIFTGRGINDLPVALRHIMTGLQMSGSKLIELDLSNNALGPIGAVELEPFLKSAHCARLETLSLNNVGLGSIGCCTVVKALSACQMELKEAGLGLNLKKIVMGRNRLEDDGARSLATLLADVKTLVEISLPQNGIRDAGIAALAKAFALNPNLKLINFSDNTLGTSSINALVATLKSLHHLKELNLDNCLLLNSGAKAIVQAVANSQSLEKIHLCGNELNGVTSVKIVSTLKDTKNLKLIDLNQNYLGDLGIRRVKDACIKHKMNNCLGGFSSDEGEDNDVNDEIEDEEEETLKEMLGVEKVDKVVLAHVNEAKRLLHDFYFNPNKYHLSKLQEDKIYMATIAILTNWLFVRRLARTIVSVAANAQVLDDKSLKECCFSFCKNIINIGLRKQPEVKERFLSCLATELRLMPYDGLCSSAKVSGAYWFLLDVINNDEMPLELMVFLKSAIQNSDLIKKKVVKNLFDVIAIRLDESAGRC